MGHSWLVRDHGVESVALNASPFNMCSDLAKLLPHLSEPPDLAWR
jgi:hypothetical protein